MFLRSMVAEGEDERTVALSARRSEHVPSFFENSGAPREFCASSPSSCSLSPPTSAHPTAMPGSSSISSASFNDYNAQLQGSALKATRAALGLPADIPFHRSVHPDFAKELDQCSARVLTITNKLLNLASTSNSSASARGKGKARLESQDDVADHFHSFVVDTMDQLLERAVSTSTVFV